jgi:hypothetical protein
VAAGIVDQNPAHELGRNRKEMGTVNPAHAVAINQAQVGFIHQGRGLQTMAGALAAHLPVGQAVKLCKHKRSELIERPRLPVAPSPEQGADVAGNFWLGVIRWHGPAVPHLTAPKG